MVFRRFTVLIIVRIILLMSNVIVLSIIFGDRRLFFNQIILALLLIFQVAELIRFVNHTNRELAKFFYALKHSDFSISFKHGGLGNSFRDLHTSMTEIVNSYKQVKIEKEAQYHLLQLVISQVHIGIIALDAQDNIVLINATAEQYLGVPGVKNWKILEQKHPSAAAALKALGDHGKKLIELERGGEKQVIAAESRTLIILDKPLTVITLHNIDSVIEQKEIEAWHKLIRILTHEIMNSVTPIASLTETMLGMLERPDGKQKSISEFSEETASDLRFSLSTIQKRSEGLLNFIDSYRSLAKVPRPTIEPVQLEAFLPGIGKLMNEETRKHAITFTTICDPLVVHFDPVLIEQVLINLITNAIHALESTAEPAIQLKGYANRKDIVIEVEDNGKGISAKELPEIFIPFFSTKKNGSGIGLSLSKQIMSLHGGSIKVQSEPHRRTAFFLSFPRSRQTSA